MLINNANITGSLIVTGTTVLSGSLAVSTFSGSGVRYLVADAAGNMTAQTASAAIRYSQTYTASAGQTTFAVTNGYTTGLIDVYLNGTKLLDGPEYLDTSGTNIVLTTGSFAGDIVEVVTYQPASGVTNNSLRQLTSFTATEGQTTFSASYVPGLLDVFYNGSRLNTIEYTAANGNSITLATASAAGDLVDVLVYSYQVGAFSGIGGTGTANQIAYWNTTNSITGSTNIVISGSSVGIGSASPTRQLFVNDTVFFDNIGSGSTTNPSIAIGSTTLGISYLAGSNMALIANSATRMYISASGNVGIGTNTPASSANYTALNINGTTGSEIFLKGANTTYGYMYGNAAAFVIDSNAATPLVFQTNAVERFRISSTGAATFSGGITAGGNINSNVFSVNTGGSQDLNLDFNTNGGVNFRSNSVTSRMYINSSGDVLIGTTTSPSAYGKVAIRGTNQGLTIQDAVSNGYRSLYFQSGNLYFYNGTNEGYLSSGGTWVNASDVTLKKDVKEIEYGLKEVMELKPKWYRMIEDDLEQIGFIAQDVEEVLPELVSTSEKGMKGLSYGQLTAVLTKALQEANAKITALEEKLERNNIQ